ncbi:c-type cytochrome [Phaeovulum sp.]|uniref:c-type cytochrome n=1 Tax=Phaeovulum sp. TaxID=2934796 RepID=UPI0039E3B273
MRLLLTLPIPFVLVAALGACLPMKAAVAPPSGADDYADFCAVCHGVSGKGDGAIAADMGLKPADLTVLAADNGGKFPKARVMSQIWGYTETTPSANMPAFGALLDSRTVLYDSGDGIATPTPLRLVQLSEYVESLGKAQK